MTAVRPSRRLLYDPKFDVFAGFEIDVEAAAVERLRGEFLRRTYGVSPDAATADQLRCAAVFAEDEDNWRHDAEGVIPLHRCGDAG